jgi:glycosyltransferase involved in cell wall biosynthesis
MTSSPRVTVLLPVYNREQFVDEAIASVVGQDFSDFELLLVDDGSTDGTPETLRSWTQRDPRVAVVTLPHNQGGRRRSTSGCSTRAPATSPGWTATIS